jgi:hypothetical protein
MKKIAALALASSLVTFGTAHAENVFLNWFMSNDIIQNSPGIARTNGEQYEYVIINPAHLEGGMARFSFNDGYSGGNGGGMHFSFGGGRGYPDTQ